MDEKVEYWIKIIQQKKKYGVIMIINGFVQNESTGKEGLPCRLEHACLRQELR